MAVAVAAATTAIAVAAATTAVAAAVAEVVLFETEQKPVQDDHQQESSHLFLRTVHAEVVFEISIGHELHDDQGRLALGYHAYQLDHMVAVECPGITRSIHGQSVCLTKTLDQSTDQSN